MLYAAAIFTLAIATGAQAQCVGESNGVNYTMCGRLGPLNIYWTNNALGTNGPQTNILFETADDGYKAFGFANAPPPDAMPFANVIFGCNDFDLETVRTAANISDLPRSPWDGELRGRTIPGVAGGFNANNLAIANSITEIRANGICGIRFERLNTLGDLVDDAQDVVTGTSNGIVWATGPADAPAQHAGDARGYGEQDFLANTGVLTNNAVVPILVGQGNVASLSTMLVGVVAALTVSLW